jgi:hypothetical protein
VRFFLFSILFVLTGCGPGLVFNDSQQMSNKEMLARASLIFVGVIQSHHIDSWPLFRLNIPGDDPASAKYWKILRREVRVEMVLRGVEPRKVVDVYEIYWTGATSGDWNFTRNGERDLFLVRLENGRYHIVRDWWRSIVPITSGPHSRLPLDDSHSLSERIALMNWWIESSNDTARISYPYFQYSDFDGALSVWRTVKLARGLLRHPSPIVRLAACRELLAMGGWRQDECRDMLPDREKAGELAERTSIDIAATRAKLQERDADWWWSHYGERENRRLLTAVNNRVLRTEICRRYEREYPGDRDTGCPADQPPPATIVTEQGDVPLVGPWPR